MKSVYIIVALALFAVVSVSAGYGSEIHRQRRSVNHGVVPLPIAYPPCKGTCLDPTPLYETENNGCQCGDRKYWKCENKTKTVWEWELRDNGELREVHLEDGRKFSEKCVRTCKWVKSYYWKCHKSEKHGYSPYYQNSLLESETAEGELLEGREDDLISDDVVLLESKDNVALLGGQPTEQCCGTWKKHCFRKQVCECDAKVVCEDTNNCKTEKRQPTKWKKVEVHKPYMSCSRESCNEHPKSKRECALSTSKP